jgi:ATP-dependent exoDNAse (exonuclease V) beta subunit
MLVGDAKQAIYRWRGGKAEQFINLYNKAESPFVVEQKVKNLPVNYRSCKAIVDFNNAFFKHISEFVFTNPSHQDIYKNCHQDNYIKNEGYVELQFLDVKDEDNITLHCEKTLETIQRAVQNGYSLGDICVITRKKKEGIAIAEYLNLHKIAVVSSESLLLKNSPEIDFIIHIISLVSQPNNNDFKIRVLSYLAEYELNLTQNKHDFYNKLIHLDLNEFFMALHTYGFDFNFEAFTKLPIYEAIESIIRQFKLNKKSNAYLQFFLDEILDFSQKHDHSLLNFISYWERNKDKLSVILPEVENAIQIITIHKSKGLEFPVVIFPFANQNLYFDINPKLWYPVNKEIFNGFEHAYVNVNKDLEGHSEKGNQLYNTYNSELELDTINLLYVVLTRAIEQLYIISENDIDSKGNEKSKQYSGLFINYLKQLNLWNTSQHTYCFGDYIKTFNISKVSKPTLHQTQLISTQKETHNLNIVTRSGYLWDTAQEKAIEKGNIIHQIMSHIKTSSDIEYAIEQSLINGIINSDQEKEIKNIIFLIINHPSLTPYFIQNLLVYNERDIITKEGHILRPDRLVILPKNESVIIDYKTGLEDIKHKQQLITYQNALEEMEFKVIKKILIYINDSIEVKEF